MESTACNHTNRPSRWADVMNLLLLYLPAPGYILWVYHNTKHLDWMKFGSILGKQQQNRRMFGVILTPRVCTSTPLGLSFGSMSWRVTTSDRWRNAERINHVLPLRECSPLPVSEKSHTWILELNKKNANQYCDFKSLRNISVFPKELKLSLWYRVPDSRWWLNDVSDTYFNSR